MKKEIAQMIDEKSRFIKSIERMLACDKANNSVDCISYKVKMQPDEEFYDEYIYIIFTNGHVKKLLATCNSSGANLKAITKAVYGG